LREQKLVVLTLLATVFFVLIFPQVVLATTGWTEPTSTRDVIRQALDKETLQRGFTIETPQKKFRVGVTPGAVGERDEVQVRLKSLLPTEVDLQGQVLLSNIYVYDIFNKDTVPVYEPIWVALALERESEQGGVLKMWDSNMSAWMPVPSSQAGDEYRAALHLPFGILAIFEQTDPEFSGAASWYDWYGAAMNEYEIGDVVEVTNVANGVTLTTTIVSRGPYTHGRIIDLPRDVFAGLADVGEGVIQVSVRRVNR